MLGESLDAEALRYVTGRFDEGHAALDEGIATWVGGPITDVRWTLPASVSALLANQSWVQP
jgi:hypothetical protein